MSDDSDKWMSDAAIKSEAAIASMSEAAIASMRQFARTVAEIDVDGFNRFVSDEEYKDRVHAALVSLGDGTWWDKANTSASAAIASVSLSNDTIKYVVASQLTLRYPLLVIGHMDTKNEITARADKGLKSLNKVLNDYPEANEWLNRTLKARFEGFTEILPIIADAQAELDGVMNYKRQLSANHVQSSGRPKDPRAVVTLGLWQALKPGNIGMRATARCMAKYLVLVGLEENEDALAETLYQTIRNHENAPVRND